MIKCPNCNVENKADSKYCSGCGYELPKPQEKIVENQEQESVKKPNKKWIAIIAFAITFVIAFVIAFFGVQGLFTKDLELNKIVKDFNKQVPRQLDQYTRLDSASTNGETNLTYHYTLTSLKKSEVNLDRLNKSIQLKVIESVKNSAELEIYRENKVTITYEYYDKNGNLLTEVSVTPEMYKMSKG